MPLHRMEGSWIWSWVCQRAAQLLIVKGVSSCPLISCISSRSLHIPPRTNYLSLLGEPGFVLLLVQSTGLLATSPMTQAAHLIIAFFPGCLKTWTLLWGQESFTLSSETGTLKEGEDNAASSRGQGPGAGARNSAHVTKNVPDLSGS